MTDDDEGLREFRKSLALIRDTHRLVAETVGERKPENPKSAPKNPGLPQASEVALTSVFSSERSGSSSSSKPLGPEAGSEAPSKPRSVPSKPPDSRAPKSGQAQADITALLEAYDDGADKPVRVRLPNVRAHLPEPGRKVFSFIELVINLWLASGEYGPYPLGCEWVGEGAARLPRFGLPLFHLRRPGEKGRCPPHCARPTPGARRHGKVGPRSDRMLIRGCLSAGRVEANRAKRLTDVKLTAAAVARPRAIQSPRSLGVLRRSMVFARANRQ